MDTINVFDHHEKPLGSIITAVKPVIVTGPYPLSPHGELLRRAADLGTK
jgi:hypothetical protein